MPCFLKSCQQIKYNILVSFFEMPWAIYFCSNPEEYQTVKEASLLLNASKITIQDEFAFSYAFNSLVMFELSESYCNKKFI